MVMSNLAEIPIFQRNQTNTTVSSAIYHANIGSGIHQNLKDTQTIRLHHIWSDHSILYVNFMAGQSPTGPGKLQQELVTIEGLKAEGSDIDNSINWINFNQTVNQNDKDILMLPMTIDELVEQVKCSPKQSSLGNDSLGYGT
ncbi:hypothetical protein G6F57_001160 [Rhizopus arrhizus]|uniref:Uncharacterized protein n=1 Tax=Rhizopus oryzae TaxID=64495 RepID=A0A9P6XD82_RHIOR|nr:hypothetical protein G6F23_001653 [Rhizopus arrhizus]KAG1426949.1 hypothetical protein G6F58_001251 [Rhizopus delemar]KAG0763526.1 hypothetical protein G6F24_005945 [Rhizopus arrhizus]KAG0797621.1 hypothetical protein G6F21_000381 [Rhizopus arrhizus]KAG0798625.1 hypothetical protein G6F22_004039 [Rhizopus arrhizus]